MANSYFQFKQFTIQQDKCAMKVTTDGCLFGAWAASLINNSESIINNCLDIGTGTGLLSLMLAQKNSLITIDAVEIDSEAALQAKENVNNSPWADRIQVINQNANELSNKTHYNLIISNPPFYENELKSPDFSKNIAHHSNELTLEELLLIIKNKLSTDGIFILLLPYKRYEAFKKMISGFEIEITNLTFVRQSVNHNFFRIMLAGKLKKKVTTEIAIEEISIKDGTLPNSDYTLQFKALLKDYYLHV